MAIVTTDSQHYTDIARKIREKTGETDLIKPEKMVVAVEKVYDAGKTAGYDNGFIAGIANIPTEEILVHEEFMPDVYVKRELVFDAYDIRKIIIDYSEGMWGDGYIDGYSICCDNCGVIDYRCNDRVDFENERKVLELPPDVVRSSFDSCEFGEPHRWIFTFEGEFFGGMYIYIETSKRDEGYDNGFIAGIANIPTEEIRAGDLFNTNTIKEDTVYVESYDIRKIIFEYENCSTNDGYIDAYTITCDECSIDYRCDDRVELNDYRTVLELPPNVVRASFDPCEFDQPHQFKLTFEGEFFGDSSVFIETSIRNE